MTLLSGLEDNCSTYFENREVNHTFPQLRSIPCSEDVNEHSTVCAFSFLSCLIQGLQAKWEFKRDVYTTTHHIFSINTWLPWHLCQQGHLAQLCLHFWQPMNSNEKKVY